MTETERKRTSYIFPGQGAQYVGMGRDFYRDFPVAKRLFEEADDILQRNLSAIIFEKDEAELTQTKNSQPAIYVTSMAILRVLEEQFGKVPFATAGLSLGEYTALTAAHKLSFQETLPLVQARGLYMHEACEATSGTMAVVLGLENEQVIEVVRELQMPNELWCANFNCPGQVVISGTRKGVEIGSKACLEKGAKKVIPLQVHGAFHSGLMKTAQEQLGPKIEKAPIQESAIQLVSNVTGDFVKSPEQIKKALIQQVSSPVLWQKAIRTLDTASTDLFIEIGPGKTLSAMNKRIAVTAATISVEKVEDLKIITERLSS